ncbi:MAG TPA: TetR/AcrR family transcriptional regulator [Actinomycetales bacterium]|jgi:AcrR family transcriptional regulator
MTPDPRITRTRARVLQSAWKLLNDVGFEGVTVELVSEHSGVSRSTLYRHWRSMPELLRDAFAEQAARRPPTDGSSTGLGALTAYAEAVATGLTHVWGRAAASLAGSAVADPEQKAVQRVFVEGTRRDLREIVEKGLATGELDQGEGTAAPGERVERLLDQLIAPLFYRYMFTDVPATPEQAVRLARDAWVAVGGAGGS